MKNIKKIIIFVSIFFVLLYCQASSAASLYLQNEAKEITVGDTFIVDVKLSNNEEEINVADTSIFFDQDILEVSSVGTGGSVFNLWTRQPVFSNESGKIMFTGGTPNGISSTDGQIIKIVFYAKSAGSGLLVFSDESSLYLNDGKGTIVKPTVEPLNITVAQKSEDGTANNSWDNFLAADKTPPEEINISLGRDPSMFDDKFFISFSAIDKDSGVKLYDVKEGDRDFVQSESPYVLYDQSLKQEMLIKVVDNAGNYKIVQFNPESATQSTEGPIFTKLYFWLVTILILFIAGFLYFKLKNKHAKK